MAEQYSWDNALLEQYYVGNYLNIAGNVPNITRATIADGKVLNDLVFLPYSGKDDYLLDSLNSTYSECSSFSSYLRDEIVMINARADVIDVVGTHEAFNTLSASLVSGVDITHRDVIKILNDVGNNIPVWVLQENTYVASSVSPAHQQTYYRWLSAVNNNTSGWEYAGDLEPYYTNIVADNNTQLLTFNNTNNDRNYNISAGSGVGFVVNGRTLTISSQAGIPDGTLTYTTVGDQLSTVQYNVSSLNFVNNSYPHNHSKTMQITDEHGRAVSYNLWLSDTSTANPASDTLIPILNKFGSVGADTIMAYTTVDSLGKSLNVGNYVSAGNNQKLTMISADNLTLSTMQPGIIYLV
jgi:hypothetical protein